MCTVSCPYLFCAISIQSLRKYCSLTNCSCTKPASLCSRQIFVNRPDAWFRSYNPCVHAGDMFSSIYEHLNPCFGEARFWFGDHCSSSLMSYTWRIICSCVSNTTCWHYTWWQRCTAMLCGMMIYIRCLYFYLLENLYFCSPPVLRSHHKGVINPFLFCSSRKQDESQVEVGSFWGAYFLLFFIILHHMATERGKIKLKKRRARGVFRFSSQNEVGRVKEPKNRGGFIKENRTGQRVNQRGRQGNLL